MIRKVFKEIERYLPDKHVHVPVASGDRTQILLLCLPHGVSVPPHSHPGFEITLQPLKGKARLPLGMGQEVLLQPGEIYFMDGSTSFNPKNPFAEDFQMLIHLVKK
jgi:quercetin dioxygenase-like cupin family protein